MHTSTTGHTAVRGGGASQEEAVVQVIPSAPCNTGCCWAVQRCGCWRRKKRDAVVPPDATWRSGGCPIPGNTQGQFGWSPEHPGIVENVPAHGRRWIWMIFRLLSNHSVILRFCKSQENGTQAYPIKHSLTSSGSALTSSHSTPTQLQLLQTKSCEVEPKGKEDE